MEKTKKGQSMREGFTTGSCATAATKAALITLLTKEEPAEVTIYLPARRFATFTIENISYQNDAVTVGIIKDAGDDPDATHGALIQSTVSFNNEANIMLDGGVGVGRVTKPGLPVSIGEAAINPVPRKMILGVVEEVLNEFNKNTQGVNVVISVPAGEEIAKKTLNGRLGIIGGISILGTRGIVVPFSTAAFKASIVQAIKVARAVNCDHVVITTGGRSEKFAMKEYEGLPEEAFIEMGDFVGFTLKMCKKLGVKRISMVGMMGKFSKIAQGVMMVHSKSAPVRIDFLAEVAKESGATPELIEEIHEATTASYVGDLMLQNDLPLFFQTLCGYCCQHALEEMGGGLIVETSIYTLKGQFLGKACSLGE
ncbi:cobalt-precorrin-5B (C1)-methyltransferase [Oikeobacillus pervagus]|uniref:Cobalt-precorrin-5B C(1)-methyltransferase n=1 Tax=Oikeobacillus pervagus TaxID=1325931 RepID=A0AAJ1WI29_9BACI|nr:cobalt-precorrin-5B (C(1))-methyltransferase [Oikeobacillus pervagus]MDQ0214230.1 cobalt-precorrin-5B (C1)-methyltransferase [Oikeobacillus pervagus]